MAHCIAPVTEFEIGMQLQGSTGQLTFTRQRCNSYCREANTSIHVNHYQCVFWKHSMSYLLTYKCTSW